MNQKLSAAVTRLHRFADRWWYFPFVGILAAADFFIAIVPTDVLLISSVLLVPRRWAQGAFFTALGSAFGSLAIAAVMRVYGPPVFEWALGPGILQAPTWLEARRLLDHHGAWAMFAMAAGPLPLVPFSAIAGLTAIPLTTVLWTSFVGRALKYFLFAWAATHAPRLLTRLFRR